MRTKKQITIAPDEAGAKEALRDFVNAGSRLKEIEGQLEQEVLKVRDKYKKTVLDLQDKKAGCFALVQAYSEAHKTTLFTRRKSLDWGHAIFGFRTGTPKVDKKRGITWDAALALMKNMGLGFVRTKEEVDKDKIIASREDAGAMGQLAKIGLSVVQTETFFLEPKEEELVNP